jgi:hypothetical protein
MALTVFQELASRIKSPSHLLSVMLDSFRLQKGLHCYMPMLSNVEIDVSVLEVRSLAIISSGRLASNVNLCRYTKMSSARSKNA